MVFSNSNPPNYAIANAARGYEAILNFLKTRKREDLCTLDDVYNAVEKDVTGKQQCVDALKKYCRQDLVLKSRLGRKWIYYYNPSRPSQEKPEILKPLGFEVKKLAKKPGPVVNIPAHNKPEIIVNETSIIINHAKCKITIEF